MSGAGDDKVFVTSWGQETDEDGTWQRWKIRRKGEPAGYMLLDPEIDAIGALVHASDMLDGLDRDERYYALWEAADKLRDRVKWHWQHNGMSGDDHQALADYRTVTGR
jgi:hypothetical protein